MSQAERTGSRTRRWFLATSGVLGTAIVLDPGLVLAADTDGRDQTGGYLDEPEALDLEKIVLEQEETVEAELAVVKDTEHRVEEGVVFEAQNQDSKDKVRVLIRETAKEEGINQNDFERVAECESELVPNAYNPSGASGVFQIIPKTWNYIMQKLGWPGWDVMNPEHNVKAAAWLWKNEGKGHWWCK